MNAEFLKELRRHEDTIRSIRRNMVLLGDALDAVGNTALAEKIYLFTDQIGDTTSRIAGSYSAALSSELAATYDDIGRVLSACIKRDTKEAAE